MKIIDTLVLWLARRLGLVITVKLCFCDGSMTARAERRGMAIYTAPSVAVEGRRAEDAGDAALRAQITVVQWCKQHHPRLAIERSIPALYDALEGWRASQPARLGLVQ